MVRRAAATMPPGEAPVTGLTPRSQIRQEFGRRLNARMVQKEMRQADLARSSGLPRDSISKYIGGKAYPTPTSLAKLAKALGCKAEDLLPEAIMSAFDGEEPALELRQAPGHPDKAWLRVNQALPFDVAAQIVALINEAGKREA
jgi:transcriptional regulator with XRE-family HTH domain